MNQTETYGFPYPECDPPLVEDSSQIAQFVEQARAISMEAERVITMAQDNLTTPPATRVTINVLPVATTDSQVSVPFDQAVTVVNWGDIFPLVPADGVIVAKGGWYLAGCHAVVSSATATVLPMVRLTVNGAPGTSWSTPAGNYGVGNGRIASLSAAPLLLSRNDRVRMEIKHLAAGSPAWDYRPHMWLVRMLEAT